MNRVLLAISFVAVAALTQAQSNPQTVGDTRPGQVHSEFSKQTLKNTYISSGVDSTTIPVNGYAAVDGVNTVNCPATGSSKCKIQADQWVQFAGNSVSGNAAGICLYVDGALINNVCYYAGLLDTFDIYTQLSTSQGFSVTGGNHTVQTQAYALDGGQINFYSVVYRVYE